MSARKSQDDEKKAELIAGLQDVRERILTLGSALPEAMQKQFYLGVWSTHEMLAHLAGQ
jgi:hypothetical protein